jgi:heme oxygenase
MEAGMRAHRDVPAVAAMHDPALERAGALERDLETLGGAAWRELPVVAAATQYAAHLATIAAQAPHLLVAHGYVRYLGDLSGGQMIGKRLQAAYGFGDDATHFYRFEQVPDVEARKHAFRASLDALPVAHDALDDVVEEAKLGFDYARRIFEELDAGRN